jgi:hypothetical protein
MTGFLTGDIVPAGDPDLKRRGPPPAGLGALRGARIDAGPSLHAHDQEDECFYVLEGELLTAAAMRPSMPQRAALSSCLGGRPLQFRAAGRPARLLLIAVPARSRSSATTNHRLHQERCARRVPGGHGQTG